MRLHSRIIMLFAVVVATMLVASPSSQAVTMTTPDGFRYTQVSDYATYTGWARIGAYIPAGPDPDVARCQVAPPLTCGFRLAPARLDFAPRAVTFWRWTGSAWGKATLTNGEWVYVYPYAVGWSWVWTQRTGWVAAQDVSLFVQR